MLNHVLSVLLGFLREKARESSTRLIAIILALTGSACALGTIRFAFVHPDAVVMVTAMTAVTTTIIVSGCIAIVNRTKKTPDDTI
jgi:hypothetical protein